MLLIGNSGFIYESEKHKVFFQDDIAYGDNKSTISRTSFWTMLHEKSLNTANNPKYGGFKRLKITKKRNKNKMC